MQPFVTRARYTRLECDEPDYQGLWAEVRTNLTHAERDAFLEALADIDVRQDAHNWQINNDVRELAERLTEGSLSQGGAAEQLDVIQRSNAGSNALQRDRLALIAPYIRAWNVYQDTGAGEPEPVPPPAEGGLAAFDHVDGVIEAWLIAAVIQGYRLGKGVRTPATVSASSPEHSSGPQVVESGD